MVMARSLQWLLVVGIAVQALVPDTTPFAAAFASARNDTSGSDNGAGVAKVNIGVGCGSSIEYKVVPADPTTPTYSYVIDNPRAQFISVHFSNFNLPRNDYVVIRPVNPDSKESRTITIHGEDKNGDFFSTALDTTQIVVELFSTGDANPINPSQCRGFTISEYRYAARPANNAGALEEVCGADNTQEAACLRARPDIFRTSNAVIRLLIHRSDGSFFCTGWLVGCAGHVITNNHCIYQDDHAANTQFEFMAQGGSCSISCKTAMGCESNNKIQGSTLITTSEDLDYTLVQLPVDPTGSYGYLQLRDSGPVLNENIYIPQHPQGWGKRIAVKTDNGYGTVESLNVDGCAVEQVAYSLDTYGGSSGSPVIATADNLVVALHHCGGCPNTAINVLKLIADMNSKGVLPPCAIYQKATPAPPPPTPAPTPPPPAPTPAPRPVITSTVDGTIFAAATTTSVDYVDFVMQEDGDVELDILSMETSDGVNFVDVNGDCNAGYLDTSIVLFRLNGNSISTADVIATNNDAPSGYGRDDGSISNSDSYMYLPLSSGRYRLAISAAPMSTDQAVARSVSPATPRVCNAKVSNYGSYRLSISTSARVNVQSPGSYIGSQCSSSATVQPYSSCSYHRENPLSTAATADGTINRNGGSVTVDRMMFTVNSFGRVTIEVSSFETVDGSTFVDVNGDCSSSYIDPVVYVFRSKGNLNDPLKMSDLIAVADDDDKFNVRRNRRSISFRDPYLSLPLPKGNYVVVVGRYPLNVGDAMSGYSSATNSDNYSPFSCGQRSIRGNYMVTVGAAGTVSLRPPGSFSGSKCSPNVGKALCTK